MMQSLYSVMYNHKIAKDTFEVVLQGDTSSFTAPGQFVNIKLPLKFLRRPISVSAYSDGLIKLIYKVVGDGTAAMSRFAAGTSIDMLVGLGNGFDTSKSGEHALLLGGGAGVAPLYGLAQKLCDEGKKVTVICGFNSADEVFLADSFKALGVDLRITTVDGTIGTKGFVTDAVGDTKYTYYYTCGPMPMMKAIYKCPALSQLSGQYSLEERMGCGFGACMGCSIETAKGPKRVCKDGPVFEKEDLLW